MAGREFLANTRGYGEEDDLPDNMEEDMSMSHRTRVEVILEDHNGFHLPMTAKLRPQTRARKIEIAIRHHLHEYISPAHKILLFDRGVLLHPDERVEPPPNLTYRIVETDTATVEVAFPVRFKKAGKKYYQDLGTGQEALAKDIAAGMAVDELRQIFARKMGVADRNTIVVSALGGVRPGPLEGGHWELNKLKTWCCRGVNVDICANSHYLILSCWGKTYLYQPEESSQYGGVAIMELKTWLVDSLITKVNDQGLSNVSITPGEIQLMLGGKQLRDGARVEWGSTVDFTLPEPAAEQFLVDEDWLWPFKFSCSVCAEKKHWEEMAGHVTDGCTHKPEVCVECLRQWISSCLDIRSWHEVTCPTCSSLMDYADVKANATEELFTRYDELATSDCLANIPDFHWCLAEGCKSGQIHRPAVNTLSCPKTLFECVACGERQCTRHGVKWHNGETCQEYEDSTKVKGEKASEALIKTTAKQCPKCNRKVTKYVGCNHITCICSHHWCYLCLEPWVLNSNTRVLSCEHTNTCPERGHLNPFGMEEYDAAMAAFRNRLGVRERFDAWRQLRPRWNPPPHPHPHPHPHPPHPHHHFDAQPENIERFPADHFIERLRWEEGINGLVLVDAEGRRGHRVPTPPLPPPPPLQPLGEHREDDWHQPGRAAPPDDPFARRQWEPVLRRPQFHPAHPDELNAGNMAAGAPGPGLEVFGAMWEDMFVGWPDERGRRLHQEHHGHHEHREHHEHRMARLEAFETHRHFLETHRHFLETNGYEELYPPMRIPPMHDPRTFHGPGPMHRRTPPDEPPVVAPPPHEPPPPPARRPRFHPTPVPEPPVASRTRNATRRQAAARQNHTPARGTYSPPPRRSPRAHRNEPPDASAPRGSGTVRRPHVQLAARNPPANTGPRTRRRQDEDGFMFIDGTWLE